MLMVISPAKTLDFETLPTTSEHMANVLAKTRARILSEKKG